MILIAESGSTKCEWILVASGDTAGPFHTHGLNPFFTTRKKVTDALRSIPDIIKAGSQITDVHFYGAGCSHPGRNSIIEYGIRAVLPEASIHVDHDLTAAARATCGNEPGIACILGTGSNAARYDGQKITEEAVSLGYVLGDEGSGAWIGKCLIRDFLYGLVPEEIHNKLQYFGLEREAVLNRIYKEPNPNTFLASFAKIMADHKNLPYVQEVINDGFQLFIRYHILPLAPAKVPVHFVGSIAWYFKDLLSQCCISSGLQPGNIIQKPIQLLVDYHAKTSLT